MAGTGDKQESAVQGGTSKAGIACMGILVLIIAGIFVLVIAGSGLR